MNINGVRTQGVTNIYASNGARKIKETNTDIGKDKIEISELWRNLSMYDNVDFNIDNSAKIEELKAKIQNATYNVDAKLTAQSILNNIKEGRWINDK